MADTLLQQFLDSLLVTNGPSIIRQRAQSSYSDVYMTYEEVAVTSIIDGSSFQGTLLYKPVGYRFNRQLDSSGTYNLAHITAPVVAKTVEKIEMINGKQVKTKIPSAAQPVGVDSKNNLTALIGIGTVLSLLNFGTNNKGEYIVYAFKDVNTCVNILQVQQGFALMSPPIFMNSATISNTKTDVYQRANENNLRSDEITVLFRNAMGAAELSKIGIWTVTSGNVTGNRIKLDKWIQDMTRYI